MWSAVLSMQEPEDNGKLGILTHRIGDAHTRVQARECGTDQRDDHRNRQYRREGSSVATKQLVAYHLCHLTNWRSRAKGRGKASSPTILVSIANKEVRGKVFQEVEDHRLNDE